MKTLLRLLPAAALTACATPTPMPTPAPEPVVAAPVTPAAPAKPKGPATRTESIVETLHGKPVEDPFRWLEEAKSPEVQGWMKEQDAFARAQLAALPGREKLEKRFAELFYVDQISTPHHRGTRWFFSRRFATKEKAIAMWRETLDGPDKVLIDPNTLSADGTVSLGTWEPSPTGQHVAYTLKANNGDESTLHVMEVATGKVSTVDVIDGAKYADPSWTPDGKGFFYTWLPNPEGVSVSDRPGLAEIRFHALGTDPKSDPLIHPATKNPQTFLGAQLDVSGRWLLVYVQHGWNSTDVFFRDEKAAKKGPFQKLVAGTEAQYAVAVWKDVFYVTTNEGAPRSKVMRVDPKHPDRKEWKELVPEQADGAVLEGTAIVGGKLALTFTHDVASKLRIAGLDGKTVRDVALPGLGVSSGLAGREDDDVAFFTFESYLAPKTVFQTSISKGEVKPWAELKLPIDPSKFVAERITAKSKDGTAIPITVIHAKEMAKDGKAPTVLYGYGGFQVSLLPAFSGGLYPWIESGGVYAVANLRGGGEFGEAWHQAGMGAKKQNVFDDVEAAARALVSEGFTSHEKLAIRGGSNGGLLVGAAITQHPELYRAAICAVPLLDMVRYHRFGSGKTWIPEYGSADEASQFETLFAYSPYHHVKAGQTYPATLLLGADSDDRVDPMHARKMAALMQSRAAPEHKVLLRIEAHSGHGGADLVKQTIGQQTDTYLFLADELGLKWK